MQVSKNNVTQLLAATGISFVIPVYQRNYDWNEDNCKQLRNNIWHIPKTTSATPPLVPSLPYLASLTEVK